MANELESYTYVCKYVGDECDWASITPVALTDVVTGEKVREQTLVRACWNDKALFIRYACEDRYAASDFKNQNDPLWEQDVVEVFIDEAGDGKAYAELVLSPYNVRFEAWITHDRPDDPLAFTIDGQWRAEQLETSVETDENQRIYTFVIPLINFSKLPMEGTLWRINFYRIDEDERGGREYQAWRPTRAVNYHITDKFGALKFAKD